MFGHDVRSATARRDAGIRTVTKVTWRAGVAGVACSALIAVAFGHHASTESARQHGQHGRGGILVPSQPPAPVKGAGQVNSGAS
jgi:hypothetical protein